MITQPQRRQLPRATRQPAQPIIAPRLGTQYWWEHKGTFNPGVAEYKGQVVLLYRAYDMFYISRLGLAVSDDGIHFTQPSAPAIDTDPTDADERLGIEDPRITQINDTYYVLHTVASYHKIGQPSDISGVTDQIPWRIRIAMHSTKDFKHYVHHDVILPDVPAKNGCLLPDKFKGAFGVYYRQYKELKLSFTHDFIHWFDTQIIAWPPALAWQLGKFGIGSPPLITKDGYLLIYHAVDEQFVYRLGLMLFDRHHPEQLLWYSDPILEPELPFEKEGYVPNVVYSCGALIRDNELWIYYGGADSVIGRAVLPLAGIVQVQ